MSTKTRSRQIFYGKMFGNLLFYFFPKRGQLCKTLLEVNFKKDYDLWEFPVCHWRNMWRRYEKIEHRYLYHNDLSRDHWISISAELEILSWKD